MIIYEKKDFVLPFHQVDSLLKIAAIICVFFLLSCENVNQSVEYHSENYKKTRSYESLSAISNYLEIGSPRHKVEGLLGEFDYSPIDGLYYYSSNKTEYSDEQEREVPVGLVVDYRNEIDEITDVLQRYDLGVIGE